MSATPEELRTFVHDALTQGLPREQIEVALQKAGWGSEQVSRALGDFAEVDFPLPVPRPRPYLSARDAFLYLVLFTTLFLAAFNLGALLFQLINRALPDSTAQSFSARELRWSISYLLVAFPIFLTLTVRQARELRANPEGRASKVRKWLTYLTLFVAAGFVIGDLVTLIHHFLDGELTTRFLLKVVVVAVLAGTAFLYYLNDLRKDEQ